MEITMAYLFEMMGTGIALLGAVLTVAATCWGSAKGCGIAGEAGAGVLSEDPSKFAKVLILEVIPGTNGLYGLVIWFLVLNQLGLFAGGMVNLTLSQGLLFFFACVPMILAGGFAAVYQGRVAASAIGLLARQEAEWAKGIIVCIVLEFYAILSLLASFLVIVGLEV